MPAESLGTKVKRRTMGVAFLLVIATLIGLSIAIYNKAFTSTVDITLRTDSVGNQLQKNSDVKVDGLIVGSVTSVDATAAARSGSAGTVAVVHIALQPGMVHLIPNNVTAQILPKTLFGEQYVALGMPSDPGPHIKAGDTIDQDSSKGALEAQTVLDNLYPLLTAVQPAQLNATLTALATALNGRGAELGQTIDNADKYLKALNGDSGVNGNSYTTQLANDLGKLGQVATEYNNVAPNLLESLQNLQVSAQTVVAKQQQLAALLSGGITASNTLSNFLASNKDRIIAVSGQTQQVFGLLNKYSPEFSCLFGGINKLYEEANTAIYNGAIHLAAEVDTDKSNPLNNFGGYVNGEQPTIITGVGPNCFGLPDNVPTDVNGNFQIPSKFVCLNDGAWLTLAGAMGHCGAAGSSGTSTSSDSENSIANSPAENAMIRTLIAPQLGSKPDTVSDVSTLLAGPLLRGQEVNVK